MSNDITPVQIKKIHIAKKDLNISEVDYRAMLSGFKNKDGEPCESSKDFTEQQANVFIHLLKTKLGWKEKKRNKILKYEELGTRDPEFASPGQLRKIDAYWNIYSEDKTEPSRDKFIFRILKVSTNTMVLKKDVNRLLKAIQSLKKTPSPLQGEGRDEVCKDEIPF